jgi:hypothetical protein
VILLTFKLKIKTKKKISATKVALYCGTTKANNNILYVSLRF